MPEEQRKPFRSVGMRMQRFSHSLMRSYLPPAEELPAPEPLPPVWQSASQAPLLWEAPPAQAAQPPAQPVAPVTPDASTVQQIAEPLPFIPNLPFNTPSLPTAPAQSSTPAVQRTPAPAPTPAPTVQRAAAPAPAQPPAPAKPNPLDILNAHIAYDAARKAKSEELKSAFDAQEAKADESGAVRRTRSRASFDYVETSSLAKGSDLPEPRKPQSESGSQEAAASGESTADDADDDSSPSAQASGPPEISRAVATDTAQSITAPETIAPQPPAANEDAAFNTPAPSVGDMLQRVEAPAERTSPNALSANNSHFTPTVPIVPEASTVPPPVVQRTEASEPLATVTSNAAPEVVQRADVPNSAPIQPPTASVIQRTAAPESDRETASASDASIDTPIVPTVEAKRQPSQSTSDNTPAVPPTHVIQRTELPLEVETSASVTSNATPEVVQRPDVPNSAPTQQPTASVIQRTPASETITESSPAADAPFDTPVEPTVGEMIQRVESPVEFVHSDLASSINDAAAPIPVAPTPTLVQRVEVPTEVNVPQPILTDEAPVTATPPAPTSSVVQRAEAPAEVTRPQSVEMNEAESLTAEPVQPSIAEMIQRAEAPVEKTSSEPIISDASPESVQLAAAPDETTHPSSTAAAVPDVSVPSAVSSEEPTQPTVTEMLQSVEAPVTQSEADRSTALPFEAAPIPPSMTEPSIQRVAEPQASASTTPEAPVIQRDAEPAAQSTPIVNSSLDSPAPSLDLPIASALETAMDSQPTQGMWHQPDVIQRTADVQPTSNPTSTSTEAVPPTSSEPYQGMWHEPAQVVSQETIGSDEPRFSEPSIADMIQQVESPVEPTGVQPVPSVELSTPAASSVVQRTAAPAEASSQAAPTVSAEPTLSDDGVVEAAPMTVEDMIQRAEAPSEAASTEPIMTFDVPVNNAPAQPIIQRTAAPAETVSQLSPQVDIGSSLQNNETETVKPSQPSVEDMIQRVEAPSEAASIEPSAGFDAPVNDVPAQPVIQRAEAPSETMSQPSPAVHAESNLPDEMSSEAAQPTVEDMIRRVEAPRETTSPVTSAVPNLPFDVVNEVSQPSFNEVIQRAAAPAETISSVTSAADVEPSLPDTSVSQSVQSTSEEIIRRADAPAETVTSSAPFDVETPAASPEPLVEEIIRRAEMSFEVDMPQREAAPSDVAPAVSNASPETIQRAAAPANEVRQSAPEPAAEASIPTVDTQATFDEMIQRAAAPAENTPQPESIVPEMPTPAAPEMIQRAEAPNQTINYPSPVTDAQPAQPDTVINDFAPLDIAEAIQRAQALGQPSVAKQDMSAPVEFSSAPMSLDEAIQRAEAPTPTAPASNDNVHPLDLFEALSSGRFNTSVPSNVEVPPSDASTTDSVIQRTPDESNDSTAIINYESQAAMSAEGDAPPQETSIRRAVDDELLSLLASVQQSSRNNPPPSSNTGSSAPPATVQRQMAAPHKQLIQREITQDEVTSGGTRAEESQESEVDIDRLARDVYKVLQNRLRIERERRDRI